MKKFLNFFFSLFLAVGMNAAELNIFANNVQVTERGTEVIVSYALNAPATQVNLVLLNGSNEIVASYPITDATALTKGTHEDVKVLTAAESEANQTWAIQAKAAATTAYAEVTNSTNLAWNFYSPQGIAVNNNVNSPLFGTVYVTMPNAGTTGKKKTQAAGLYLFNSQLEALNTDPYTFGLTFAAGNFEQFKRIAIDPETDKLYVNDATNNKVYVIDPNDLTKLESTIAATGHFTKPTALVVDANKLYVLDNPQTTTGGKLIAIDHNDQVSTILQSGKWANATNSIALDNHGGFWVCQNRGQIDGYPAISHVGSTKSIDFSITSSSSSDLKGLLSTANIGKRGAMAVNTDGSRLALCMDSKVRVYAVAYAEGTNIPSLTTLWTTPTTIGSNIDGLAFDAADNLYISSASSERFYAYCTPKADNSFITPACAYTKEADSPQLNIFASHVSVSGQGTNVEVSYILNAPAKALSLLLINGDDEVVSTNPISDASKRTKGSHQFAMSVAQARTSGLHWAIKAEADPVSAYTLVNDITDDSYKFYVPQGVAVNNIPTSPYFGKIYVAHTVTGTPAGSVAKAGGLYVFDVLLNAENSSAYSFGLTYGTNPTNDRGRFKRIKIGDDGSIYVNRQDTTTCIYKINPANMNTIEETITNSKFTKIAAFAPDGDAMWVLDYGTANAVYKVVNGVATQIVANSTWANADVDMVADGRGGVWIAQNRYSADANAALAHVAADGTIDFKLDKNSPAAVLDLFPRGYNMSYRGTLALNSDKSILAFGGNKKVSLYAISYDATTGVPSINSVIWRSGEIGTNIDGIAFDAADNLYFQSASAERLYVYTTPKANNSHITPTYQQDISYSLNGGVTNDYGWKNGADMYAALGADIYASKQNGTCGAFAFKAAFTGDLGTPMVNGTISSGPAYNITTFDLTFFTGNNVYATKWKWLGDYLDATAEAAKTTKPTTHTDYMRYALAAFFANSVRASYPKSADYTDCGVSTLGAYMPTWKHSYDNATRPVGTVELIAPYHETKTFKGWFDNENLEGTPYTTIDPYFCGTLYAGFIESKPDPQAYEQKKADAKYNRNITITGDWMYSVTLGNWDANKPEVTNGSECRGIVAKGGKVYIPWRPSSVTPGSLKLKVYDAKDGFRMQDITLKDYIFQQPANAPAGGVWDYTKFTAGWIDYPLAAIEMDGAGNMLVANLVLSGSTYQIWKINPETGEGELVVYMGGNSGVQNLAARFPNSTAIRLDRFAVYGDVNHNAIIITANANSAVGSNKVYRFNIVDGTWDGNVTEITCKNGANAAAEGVSFSTSAKVAFAQDGQSFYIDGGSTWPERFDMDGNMLESFNGVKDANDEVVRPVCSAVLKDANKVLVSTTISGCHEFKVGNVQMWVMAAGMHGTSGYSPRNTAKIFAFQDENEHFDEMLSTWEVPQAGFGNVTNTQVNQFQHAVVVNDSITELYIFVPGNGIAKYTFTVHGIGVTLDENGTEEAIEDLVGEVANVRTGRTFQKNSTNHTICLPFSLDEAAFAASALAAGCTKLEEFVSAEIVNKGEVNETLVLNMNPVEPKAIEAGKPYIIAWADDAEEIPTPLFEQVTIATATPTPVKDNEHSVSFCGTFIPKSVTAGDKGILFVGATGDLFWPNVSGNIKGLRCYFTIDLDKAGTAIYRGMAAKLGEDRNAPMSVENTSLSKQEWSETARKLIEQGRVVIISNGERFDMNGRKL